MIIFMTENQFLKNKKKLVEPKDYVICDATDDATGELSKFSNTMSLDGVKPPKGLVRLLSDDGIEDSINPEKLEKLEKRFFKGAEFQNSMVGLVLAFIKPGYDKNYFIVFKKKDYKSCGKSIIKAFKKAIGVSGDDNVVFTFEDIEDNKKILRQNLSNDVRSKINENIKKSVKKIEKNFEDDDEKKKKKKKEKEKEKAKKKKKKKKKSRFLDFD